MCVEDDSGILRVRDELDQSENRSSRNTVRDRNGCRLFAVDCNDLCPVVQTGVDPLKCRFCHQKPTTKNIEQNIMINSVECGQH